MEPESIEPGEPPLDMEHARAIPRASEWLWRPWYAKLWWAGVALYWTGKLASFWIVSLEAFYETAIAGWLNILFYPPTALFVFGVGFVRAWMAYHGWEFEPPTHDQFFPKRSAGGWSDPYSDPLDPRSGMLHWRHFHPDK